jgi:TonB family protein
MVYSNPPIPFTKGNAKPRLFLHNILPNTIDLFPEDSKKSLVFDALRHQISGGAEMEDVLESAASAAQDLTTASGAALAMGAEENILCVGRSGETAPPIGAQVSVNSGISGECMRTGKYIVCDDTQLDSRVDAEVCLSLGLRSLAAVPLRAAGDKVGLLEVFSNYPSNFSSEHVEILRGLGDLVELAYARQSTKPAAELSQAEEELEAQSSVTIPDVPISEPRAIKWLRDSQALIAERKFPYWAIPVVLIAVLLAFRGWLAWQDPVKATAKVSAPIDAPQEISGADLVVLKPSPTRESRRKTGRKEVSQEASPEAQDVVVHNFQEEIVPAPSKKEATDDSVEPPQLAVLSSDGSELSNLVKKQAVLPKPALMVSQGVVRGGVVHRVPPAYPAEARSKGVSGEVVLKASINEKGAVTTVEPVSGPPVLVRAASDAVRQWRYRPSLLNGTPVPVETEITVNFKKP